MSYFVYIWKRPCGTPFYVGMGNKSRPYQRGRNHLADAIRDKIERSGGVVEVEVIEVADRKVAGAEEVRLIALYGRRDLGTGCLANLTCGGEGSNELTGDSLARQLIGCAKGGRGNKGHVPTPEHRAAVSAARKGRKLTPEQRMAAGSAMRGKHHSEEAKEKLRKAHAGRVFSPEHRAKISAAKKGKPAKPKTPEQEAHRLAMLRAYYEKKRRDRS